MGLYLAIGVLSYLIGSIPAGYVVARCVGIDIRREGSGNIGATNVLRVLGKPYGYGVFLFDFLKGVAAVQLAILMMDRMHPVREHVELIGIAAGVLCVIGHVYPIWLGFKGGKGVATSVGVLFGLMPLAALIVVVVWLIVFQSTKYVSVASVAAAAVLPLAVIVIQYLQGNVRMAFVYFSICLTIVIVWRHRSNLSRLMKGTEQSFKQK